MENSSIPEDYKKKLEEVSKLKIVTVILARAGSRRILRKNVIPYKGRPLIHWTLQAAWALGFPMWVFTDMPEVDRIARDYHANVRPKLFEREDGYHETGKELAEYNKEMGADVIVYLQATSPDRDVNTMRGWILAFLDGDYDVGLAAKILPEAFYYGANVRPLNFDADKRDYNSNVKGSIFRETGSFYIFKASQIEKNHFTNSERKIIFLDQFDKDIDVQEDLLR